MIVTSRSLRWALGFGLALCLIGQAALAQSYRHSGHKSERRTAELPTLSLQASASSQVMQDRVTLTLAGEIEGEGQAAVAAQLTEMVNATLERAGQPEGIRVRTGAWRVWPTTDRDGRVVAWRGRAEILLESQNIPAAATLAARLSEPMAISQVTFDLSEAARAAEEQRLLQEVASAFADRADEAAKAFGFESYRIQRLELGGAGAMPQPRGEAMLMRATAADAAAPPQLEPGETTVSLSVQGEVVLQTSAESARPR